MRLFHNTDREWKRWDKRDLYYAVLSHSEYRNGQNMEGFFSTGKANFSKLLDDFKRFGIPLDPSGNALDFGCGVGRLLIPFGNFFQRTLGIDISQDMLEEARKNINPDTTELRLFDGNDLAVVFQMKPTPSYIPGWFFNTFDPRGDLA